MRRYSYSVHCPRLVPEIRETSIQKWGVSPTLTPCNIFMLCRWQIATLAPSSRNSSCGKISTTPIFAVLSLQSSILSLVPKKHKLPVEQNLRILSIVVTGSECGKFGQAGHIEYASGKAGLQYGLVRGVMNEIVRLNSKARINAIASGWGGTPLIEGRLDDPDEMWTEAQATVPLRKIAQPEDVARAIVFLASHRAAGHISGECLNVDGGMEGSVLWKAEEVIDQPTSSTTSTIPAIESITQKNIIFIPPSIIHHSLSPRPIRKIQILLSIDFDVVSSFLDTGASSTNNMADYSSGFFAGHVGVPRFLKLFRKHNISSNVT